MKVSSTEVQNNFGRYLKIASDQEDVVITKKGRDIARIVSCGKGSLIAEQAAEYNADDGYGVSYEDFIRLTENSDLRYELIDGEVYCLASPNYLHQSAVAEIYGIFYNWFKGKKCRPLTSPFDVTLIKSKNNINVVQPDIIVMCDTENIDSEWKYKGVPALVVEVLSIYTKRKDMIRKLDLYIKTDVKEYWLIDPVKKEIYVYSFEDRNIKNYEVYTGSKIVESSIFPGLKIPLDDIFIV